MRGASASATSASRRRPISRKASSRGETRGTAGGRSPPSTGMTNQDEPAPWGVLVPDGAAGPVVLPGACCAAVAVLAASTRWSSDMPIPPQGVGMTPDREHTPAPVTGNSRGHACGRHRPWFSLPEGNMTAPPAGDRRSGRASAEPASAGGVDAMGDAALVIGGRSGPHPAAVPECRHTRGRDRGAETAPAPVSEPRRPSRRGRDEAVRSPWPPGGQPRRVACHLR